jgi:hypothetical protein
MFATLRQWVRTAATTPRWLILLLTGGFLLVAVLVIPTLYRAWRQPSQAQILERWATATQRGDYATAATYMAPDFIRTLWQDRTMTFMRQGRMGMYHLLNRRQTGNSLTATLYWHTEATAMPGMDQGKAVPAGDATPLSTEPLCLQVQVGPDGKVTPLSDYHPCRGGE